MTPDERERHPALVSARRDVATADNKIEAFQVAALSIGGLVNAGEIERPDAIDDLIELGDSHGLFGGGRDLEHVISEAMLGRRALPQHAREKANGHDTSKRGLKLVPFDAVKLSTTPAYLIKGILPRGGIAVFWGPPKCGKSFTVFDGAMHVALGWTYRGHKVRQGCVVYLALEGGHGFHRRIVAWRRHHLADHNDPVPFFLCDVPLDLIAERDKLIATIRAQTGGQVPALVVVDTLNRGLVGDENKSDDMAKFIRAIDAIRVALPQCTVAVIHHCGIAGSRPRGHTSLSGADDAQIRVERDDATGCVVMTVEHMKDGEAGTVITSRLERVELGTDDDGDVIDSCVVVPANDSDTGTRDDKIRVGGQAKVALDLLERALVDAGQRPPASNHIPQQPDIRVCPVDLWRSYFYAATTGKPDTKQKAFVRSLNRLQQLGAIGIWNDTVWLTGHAGHARTSGQMSGDTQTRQTPLLL